VDISIGLPATIPGATGDQVIEWARRADATSFHSLGIIDRLVFPNLDPIVTLSVAAGATQRIRLMPTILLAAARNGAVLAKELASLDRLSNGRLTVGIGAGSREDDFAYAGLEYRTRGRRLDHDLELFHHVWTGQTADGLGPVGPEPVQHGGPPIVLGGYGEVALQRLAHWGSGYISGGAPADRAQHLYQLARKIWSEAGREGQPRLYGSAYYALGDNAKERGGRYIMQYYGEGLGTQIAQYLPDTPDAIRGVVQSFAEVGADELFLWPTTPDVEGVDRLADIVR
jgi:alkanesulfonate monooxygenase SsuD/methylene tetrahydromethanopterin reductase-like flavin-dependent oxidoreductase (luciferase family)